MGFPSKIIKRAHPDPEHEKVLEQNSYDRLSNLPTDILYHILSFLSVTEVVKTRFLSRKWRYTWASTPYLNFDFKDFRNLEQCLDLSYTECIIKFWVFVKWTIMIRDEAPICRLRFHCDYLNDYQLKSLFNVCVTRKVQELEIISGCGPLNCPIYGTGEEEHIGACIQDLQSLVELVPWEGFWNLKTIKLTGVQFPDADITENLFSIHYVEELSVSAVFALYFSPAFGTTTRTFSRFRCLRRLKLELQCNADHCEGLINLLHHSPNLEALYIRLIKTWKASHWESREADVSCLSRKLKEIEIVACPDPVILLQLIKFFLQNGKSLERIKLTQMHQKVDPEGFYALREVQLASEAVSVSIYSSSAAGTGRKELIQLVYGKSGVTVQTKAGKSKFRMKRSIRIAAKKSGRST